MFLLYGVTLKTSKLIREELERYLATKTHKLHTVCRYRKEGVFQYADSLEEGAIIILEEELQGASSYEIEELTQLTDIDSKHKIIFLMNRKHYGDDFVKAIYACGILNAVFYDDIAPKVLLQMIMQDRTNEEARVYYGIQGGRDAEKENDIVNEIKLSTYLEYVEGGDSVQDINDRYRFASSMLGDAENQALSGSLSSQIMFSLKGNEVYQFYKNKRGRGRFFLSRKKVEKPEKYEENKVGCLPKLYPEPEKDIICQKPNIDTMEVDEDLISVLDRFRECKEREVRYCTEHEHHNRKELLLQFGSYLQEIDN